MTVMIHTGLLHCLLFMLTSAEMEPHSKVTAGLQMYGKENRHDQTHGSECRAIGGKCLLEGKKCPANKPIETEYGSPYCVPGCRCCHPVITQEVCEAQPQDECFWSCASCQCFCIITANNNWTEAGSKCLKHGWQLPHPTDAVALRSTIVQQKGNCDYLWLNAKSGGTDMVWQDNEVHITTANPWFPSVPSFPLGTCLEIRASEAAIAASPDSPYFVDKCSEVHKHVLCELK